MEICTESIWGKDGRSNENEIDPRTSRETMRGKNVGRTAVTVDVVGW